MHNHLHIVLHVDSEKAKNWSTAEVLRRWHQLFKGTLLTQITIAPTPEQSDFTSIQLRIKAAVKGEQPPTLLTF
mgnify:CR=1 FL=1